jgi:hypothetical protein
MLCGLLVKNPNKEIKPGMMGHAYNPSYSGGRGRRSSKPAWAKVMRPYLRNKKKEKEQGV